jgi:hypothetical protein
MSAYQHVRALGWWGRQPPFKVFGTRLEPFLKTRRERTASHELSF